MRRKKDIFTSLKDDVKSILEANKELKQEIRKKKKKARKEITMMEGKGFKETTPSYLLNMIIPPTMTRIHVMTKGKKTAEVWEI